MASKAISLFEKAVSISETQQLEFATQIDKIIDAFPPQFIAQELFPFLATWIPRNNQKIVSVLCSKVELFGSVKGAFAAFAPVVESLLASEDKNNAKMIRDGIFRASESHGPDACPFIKRLVGSPYDFVRSFVPSIISILSSDEDKKTFCSYLAYDGSFNVRYNACLSIPKLPAALGQQVAISLLKDGHSRIRALIPVICVDQPYFFSSIAPALVVDHDWFVRSSLAKEVVRSQNAAEALAVCSNLAEDSVWCVSLSALISITAIVKREGNAVKNNTAIPKILNTLAMIMPYPQTSLKNAVIDAFVAIYQNIEVSNSGLESFVNDIITNHPPSTRLHFIKQITDAKLKPIVGMIRERLSNVVEGLLSSQHWRIRLGILNSISGLTKLSEDKDLEKKFRKICFEQLDDKSMPVRRAASVELAKFFVDEKSDSLYPEDFNVLKNSNSFRGRQSAVILLSDIAKLTTKENKAKIIKLMETFEHDPCVNVVNLAKDLIAEIQ